MNSKEKLIIQLKEMEEEGYDVEFYKKITYGLNLMDRQLSEDKKLFAFLTVKGLVNEIGKEFIEALIKKHTEEFKE